MRSRIFITISILFTLVSCSTYHPKQYEQQVYDEVFINIVELTYKDLRIYSNPSNLGQENNPEFIRQTEFLKSDTLALVVAVHHDRNINFQKYSNKKFYFKNLHEIPREDWMLNYQTWKSKYNKFIGALLFSKIKFNNENNKGIIGVQYSCGGNCGLGYEVHIKKVKNRWIVDKVDETSIF